MKYIMGLLMLMVISSCTVSEGDRSGLLAKFSKKGMVVKTWEGSLLLGEGNASIVWNFSVNNDDVAMKLSELVGKKILVEYKEKWPVFWNDTNYDVLSIKENE